MAFFMETTNVYVLALDLPGMSKDEVKVEVVETCRVLQISGERKKEEEGENDTWHCRERSSGGPFVRRVRLPENADAELAKAKMENGVLTVMVPKGEVLEKPKAKADEISEKKWGKSRK